MLPSRTCLPKTRLSASAIRLSTVAILLSLSAAGVIRAAEGGVSVYPAGVETIMPGMMPPSGKTILLEFNNFYQANGVMDGKGHSLIPGFHLRVSAVAGKVVHNWGVKALGGVLVSSFAVPVVYEHLTGPFGTLHKTGIGNPDIGVMAVAYVKGDWHCWYGWDVYAPGAQYDKNAPLNIGQHYFATAPEGAFTYLPHRGKDEISSKFQYIVNFKNPADQYHAGHEFVWEYAAMHNFTKKLSMGVNGYSSLQATDDRQNGLPVDGGNRGRVLATGPEIKYHIGRAELIVKYQKEFLVENRTRGNSFWCQLGVPLWTHEK